jgi:tetratricopeptide (TPR) repeat protein
MAGREMEPHNLNDLFRRYLDRQTQAHALGQAAAGLGGAVTPFEAVPVQPVDARLAWDGATELFKHFSSAGAPSEAFTAPSDWASLVAAHEPVASLAFAAGNYPQLIRDVHPLLGAKKLSELRLGIGWPLSAPGLPQWAERATASMLFPQALMALGLLRLARNYEAAMSLAGRIEAQVPSNWKAAFGNEKAALLWHQGKAEEAYALWQAEPTSVPVLFNLGMAALFLDRPQQARPALLQAVEQLPDTDAWHHLGRLYAALCIIAS